MPTSIIVKSVKVDADIKYNTTILETENNSIVYIPSKHNTTISTSRLFLQRGEAISDMAKGFNDSLSSLDSILTASINEERSIRIGNDTIIASDIKTITANYQNADINTLATIGQTYETISNAGQARSELSTTLTANYQNADSAINATLTNTNMVVAGYFNVTDGSNPIVGNIKIVNGIQHQYLGSTLGENSDGWVRTDYSANQTAEQVKGWVATASSLVVDPLTKQVTGWQYGDGSGFDSVFKISANSIELAGTTAFTNYNNDNVNYSQIQGTKPPSNATVGADWGTNLSSIPNFGSLSTKDMISAAELDLTVIDGGYIKTSLLTADNIIIGTLHASQIDLNGTYLVDDSGKINILNNSISKAYTGSLNTGTLNPDSQGTLSYIGTLQSAIPTITTSKINVTISLSGSIYAAQGSSGNASITATVSLLINGNAVDSLSFYALGVSYLINATLAGSHLGINGNSTLQLRVTTSYINTDSNTSITLTAKDLVIVMER